MKGKDRRRRSGSGGLRTVIYDVDSRKVQQIRASEMPFFEEGAQEMLRRGFDSGRLTVEDRPDPISQCR